jgi:hypothetical protein
MRDPLPALGTDPVHGLEGGGSVLNDGEILGSEAPDQLLRQDGSNALHQAAAAVALDPSAVVGGTVFMVLALSCSPCSLSLTHQPLATSHSPAVTEGSLASGWNRIE